MALEDDQEVPVAAGPRQTRQVPRRRLVVRAGSSSQGASISEASLEVCVAPMVGAPVKLAAVQLCSESALADADSGAVETYQSEGLSGSMATEPPSPAESCGHRLRISRRRWLRSRLLRGRRAGWRARWGPGRS